MTQEALKLALDALENHTAIKHPLQIYYRDKAITAIKEALAQTQEPVDYEKLAALGWQSIECPFCGFAGAQAFPQRTWAGLTRDEQSFVYSNLHNATSRIDSFWVDFANAIEAKLKEKNT